MRRFSLISGILLGCALAMVAQGQTNKTEPTVNQIALKDIWAFEMPGTRDVRELEPDTFGAAIRKLSSAEQLKKYEKSLTSQIRSQLQYNKPGQSASQAFAVVGTGAEALREAAAVLSGKKKPQTSFPANSNVSVIFFSHESGYFVHLDKVETQPEQIVISYRFVPHETKHMTSHFAIIPVDKLPPGEVKVDIERLPMEKNFTDAGFKEPPSSADSQVVAQSFRFKVEDRSD